MNKEDGKQRKLSEMVGRYKYAAIAAALGVILLLWPWQSEEQEQVTGIASNNSVHELERRMEEILAKINGVGRVQVMLTLESGGELILATDSTLRYSGSPQNPNDYDRASETVTISGSNGSEVVVTQERSAKYRGALIVCEGGDNDKVRLRIVEAVCALTGLGSDRVAVMRWGGEYAGVNTTLSSGEELS